MPGGRRPPALSRPSKRRRDETIRAVTASSSAAAEAGVAILRQDSNAVDAAVATALASCVADGCNTGLGGYGGHMVVGPVWGDPRQRTGALV